MLAIETHQLTRMFTSSQGVSALNLAVPERSIYGFLGPNGAGKTTTIRLLLGLIAARGGTIRFFGHDPLQQRAQLQALIETPSLYGHLSALDNLEVTRRLIGASKSAMHEALSRVGLDAFAKQRVREFSLGMRQRLGLALTLISKPRLLILDEPSNGLDPAGMVDMRRLLRALVDDGLSIFMSSHLLHEVAQMADHVGVINAGKLVFEGRVSSLHERAPPRLWLECSPLEQVQQWLQQRGIPCQCEGAGLLLSQVPDSARLNAELVAEGFAVRQLHWRTLTLEDLFFRLTGSAP